jgi:hypothetical protein
LTSVTHWMRSGVGKYTKGYAPSKLKALNGPHTSIGLILISIEAQTKRAAGTGCSLFSCVWTNSAPTEREQSALLFVVEL